MQYSEWAIVAPAYRHCNILYVHLDAIDKVVVLL